MQTRATPEVRPLSEREAEVYIASTCFKTGPPRAVGLEIERLLYDIDDPMAPVPVSRVRDALACSSGALPGGGVITIEPGGQLELSSLPAPDLRRLIEATRHDLCVIDRDLASAGLRPGQAAFDADRPPVRSLDLPRYAAMQRYFDRQGPVGRAMMCSTASVQVCLDAGDEGTGPTSALSRWRRLHRMIPVLVAMFANSPFRDGAPSGWKCTRQAVWLALDPARTRPLDLVADPGAAWARYALDAGVLCIPDDRPGARWDAPAGLTMRAWLRGAGPRPVTRADLDCHLTTLFPPVRPRGFLELRVIDAQIGDDWEVAAAVVAALMDDEDTVRRVDAGCPAVDDLTAAMTAAARDGLSDPALASAALTLASAAIGALNAIGADEPTRDRVERFVDRYTAAGRSPADDRLDHWQRTGTTHPLHAEELR